ncbi:activated RNA polymerase II transcriptional coactivator p15-like [Clavelina lepadiformis]|uniref:Activated RNA polymerase II transcriptional coactivator p15 n=1 Tax=Clavelina lepadiformis TaxID=159417 RepID=A0ABP0FL59_CLALP
MPRQETLTSSDSDSENEKRIKAKLKKETSRKRKADGPSKGSAPKRVPPPTTNTASTSGEEEKISLGKMKFVTVRPFKNMIFVDIREHYEKDGELKPGKKGISLQAEQWQRLKQSIDMIDEKIQQLC